MGNIVGTMVRRFSSHHHADADADADAIPSRGSSYAPNAAPGFSDKCACGDNGGGSVSVTGRAGGGLDGCVNGRHGALCKEVGDEEMRLATRGGLRSGCVGDGDGKGRQARNGTIGNADAREHGGVDRADNACNQKTAGHVSCDLEDGSTVVSRVFAGKVSPEKNSNTSPDTAVDLESNRAVERHTHMSDGSRQHGVSPANSLLVRGACDELINGARNLDYKRTPWGSVKDEVVPDEDEACASLDVRGCESAPKASIKRRANRKQTNRESSNRTTVLNENTTTLVPLDAKYPEMANRHPFTRSRAKALSTSPESSTRSGRSLVPRLDPGNQIIVYDTASQHLLTQNKGVALSISTPESLKLRSTRSGRLIVPRLDPGSQDIIYAMDGSICGITNFDPRRPQGFYSEPPPKRRKKFRCSSPPQGRLLLF